MSNPRAQEFSQWLAEQMAYRSTRDLPWWRVRQWLAPVTTVLASLLFAIAGGIITLIISNVQTALITVITIGIVALTTSLKLSISQRSSGAGLYSARSARFRVAVSGAMGCGALGIGALQLVAADKIEGWEIAPIAVLFAFAVGSCVGVTKYRDKPLVVSLGVPNPVDLAQGVVAGAVGASITLATGTVAAGWQVGLKSASVVFVCGMTGMSLVTRFTAPRGDASDVSTPIQSFRTDRRGGIIFAFIGGLAVGIATGFPIGFVTDRLEGTTSGAIAGAVIGLLGFIIVPQSIALLVCTAVAPAHCPRRLMRFLMAAREVGLFRQVGSLYQFRHAELQDYLSTRP